MDVADRSLTELEVPKATVSAEVGEGMAARVVADGDRRRATALRDCLELLALVVIRVEAVENGQVDRVLDGPERPEAVLEALLAAGAEEVRHEPTGALIDIDRDETPWRSLGDVSLEGTQDHRRPKAVVRSRLHDELRL